MIKEALRYIVDLSEKADIIPIDGHKYSTKLLHRISAPMASAINVTTLAGLIDYIKSNIDFEPSLMKLMLHVASPTSVVLYNRLRTDGSREAFMSAQPMLPSLTLNNFVAVEQFIINLQSSFIPNEDRDLVLKSIGRIEEKEVKETGDDGVSQAITVRTGIARKENVVVPNPVNLIPYRTFQEIYQPESQFILRLKDGPVCGLFEADGGAWKMEAMASIKAYLVDKLGELPVAVIA